MSGRYRSPDKTLLKIITWQFNEQIKSTIRLCSIHHWWLFLCCWRISSVKPSDSASANGCYRIRIWTRVGLWFCLPLGKSWHGLAPATPRYWALHGFCRRIRETVKAIDLGFVVSSFVGSIEQRENVVHSNNALAACGLRRNDCDWWWIDVQRPQRLRRGKVSYTKKPTTIRSVQH